MTENKVVKTVIEASTVVGLTAATGYIAKKVLKEDFLKDPSSNVMNYVKMTAVVAGSMLLRQYLIDQKVLPKSLD